ncbi:MAG: cysteine hydrolase [Lewinella sp.]|nr:cysteine hydrolase [Lewinella sp.]
MHPIPPIALLLVDIQQGLLDDPYWGGDRNNPEAEARAGELLTFWRSRDWPVFHVKHNSTNPASPLVKGKPGNAIQEVVAPLPEEPLFEKTVNSAFIGTGLEDHLRAAGIQSLVVVGLTTNHCISTTVRMAANLGFPTWLVEDATATHDAVGPDGARYPAALMHATALASLHQEFATIVTTKHLLDTLR